MALIISFQTTGALAFNEASSAFGLKDNSIHTFWGKCLQVEIGASESAAACSGELFITVRKNGGTEIAVNWEDATIVFSGSPLTDEADGSMRMALASVQMHASGGPPIDFDAGGQCSLRVFEGVREAECFADVMGDEPWGLKIRTLDRSPAIRSATP